MKLICNVCRKVMEVDENSIDKISCPTCVEKNNAKAREKWKNNPKKKQKGIKSPLNERKEPE